MSACPCGSGVPFVACHGASRAPIDWRLEAFAYLHNFGGMYPELRPSQDEVLEFAERAAAEVDDEDETIPPRLVEEGVALLDAAERRRLVAIYTDMHPDRWKKICRHTGSRRAAERTLVASAVRGAIGDHRRPPRRMLEELDADAEIEDPGKAAVIAVPAGLVWSIDAVEEAIAEIANEEELGPLPNKRDDRRLLAAMDRVAARRWRPLHAERLVWLTAHVAEAARTAECDVLGALLEAAAEQAAADAQFRSEIACSLLAKYAIGLSVQAPQPLLSPN